MNHFHFTLIPCQALIFLSHGSPAAGAPLLCAQPTPCTSWGCLDSFLPPSAAAAPYYCSRQHGLLLPCVIQAGKPQRTVVCSHMNEWQDLVEWGSAVMLCCVDV